MKQINDYIIEKFKINSKTSKQHYNYYPKDKDELKELIKKLIEERGNEANLNDIDTSQITNMDGLFKQSDFNGDISNWDVSNVKTMRVMFMYSKFNAKNGDISNWNINNVKDMYHMFDVSPLQNNPPKWYKE